MSFKLGSFPTKTFRNDFQRIKQALIDGENFALSRFSDGEMRIMQKVDYTIGPTGPHSNYTTEDYRTYDHTNKQDDNASNHIMKAYKHKQDNYFCGLSCQCCVGKQNFRWMLQESDKSDNMLTWANLFLNGNYINYVQEIMPIFSNRNVVLTIRDNAEIERLPFDVKKRFDITNNSMIVNIGLIDIIGQHIKTNKIENYVFLFSAGSLSNILIYELYKLYPNNVYIDIGTTLHPFVNLDIARGYLISGIERLKIPLTEKQQQSLVKGGAHGRNEKVCIW